MRVESLVEAFFAAGKAAAVSTDRQELHKFRIAAKRLRYTIEILDPKGGSDWLRRLKVVQRQLGDMNDAFVAEAYLRGLPVRSAAARPLPAVLRAKAMRHIAAFQATWRRRFGSRTEKAWLTWARSIAE